MGKDAKSSATNADAALVVFGLDDSQRPHAAWFGKPDAELATKAAALMSLQVLPVTGDEHRAIASALPAGRVFASGKGFVPFCAAGLYERLKGCSEAFTPAAPAVPTEPVPEPANVPATWAEIGDRSLVLACDGESPGWFEAVIVEAKDDLFGLRWRQWPDLPPFVRRREHLSLLSGPAYQTVAEVAREPVA